MRHRKAGRQLGRNATHRLALMRNLTRALIEHERVVTTVEKAKEARMFVEKLITLARKDTLHARRLAMARLGSVGGADLLDKKGDPVGKTVLQKLFDEIGPRFRERPGGYTRVIKRHERRLGDAGHTAFLELLKEGEEKVQKHTPYVPPAPQVAPKPTTPAAPEPSASATPTQPAEEKPAAEEKKPEEKPAG